MSRYRFLLTVLMILSLVGISALKADSERKQRKFDFTYSATVQVPEGAHTAKLWLPFPKSDENQEITDVQLKSEYPISFSTDAEYGNSVVSITSNAPKPGP